MKQSAFIIALLFTLTFSAFGQSLNKPKLDSLLRAVADNNEGMGNLALAKNGSVIYQKAIGNSTVAEKGGVPANTKTRYRIGSISKMFTAVMIFQLIEDGKLTLDTKLSAYYPQIPNADRITMAHVLYHRSGLYNFVRDTAYQSYMTRPQTQEEMLARFANQPSDFMPDSKTAYSNTNFILLGYIAEQVYQKDYQEILKTKIAKKLGLTDTYYGHKIIQEQNEAFSYQPGNGWKLMPETDMSIPGGAGAVVSTAADLVKFIDGLFNGKLIGSKYLAMMQTVKNGVGMGMFRLPLESHTAYGHNGDIDGFSSVVGYFPEERLAYAYCANGVDYPIRDLVNGAVKIALNMPFKLPVINTIKLSSEDLDKYVGNYSSLRIPIKVAITKSGNTLMAQATGQSAFALKPLAKDKFGFALAGIVMDFRPIFGEFTLRQGGGEFPFTRDED